MPAQNQHRHICKMAPVTHVTCMPPKWQLGFCRTSCTSRNASLPVTQNNALVSERFGAEPAAIAFWQRRDGRKLQRSCGHLRLYINTAFPFRCLRCHYSACLTAAPALTRATAPVPPRLLSHAISAIQLYTRTFVPPVLHIVGKQVSAAMAKLTVSHSQRAERYGWAPGGLEMSSFTAADHVGLRSTSPAHTARPKRKKNFPIV